jgi:hypothetical protein
MGVGESNTKLGPLRDQVAEMVVLVIFPFPSSARIRVGKQDNKL